MKSYLISILKLISPNKLIYLATFTILMSEINLTKLKGNLFYYSVQIN